MVKEFTIEFNKDTTYAPGQTIAGTLILEVEEPKSYQQVAVHLKGKGCVRWSRGSGEHRRTYYAREKYADEKVVLWKCEDSPDGLFPVGRYTYSFEIVIPADCPSSFKSTIGNIVYTIKGVIKTGTLKLNRKVCHIFQVVESVSIDTFLQQSLRDEKRKTVGCLCCVSGEIVFNAQVEQSGFQMGDDISASYYIENGSGRRVCVRCDLVEMIVYIARGSQTRSSFTIARHTGNSEYIFPRSTSGQMYAKISVPYIRPAMTRSNIIKSNFVLNVTVVIPRGINSVINLPVSLGNATVDRF